MTFPLSPKPAPAAGGFDFLGGVDLHNHVLPGIDDGAPDLSAAVAMVEAYNRLGFWCLHATPHVMTEVYPNTPSRIEGALGALRAELRQRGNPTKVTASAEYYVDEFFADRIASGNLVPLPRGHVLIEWSMLGEPLGLASVAEGLRSAGYRVLIAHPERYPYWHDAPERWRSLREDGVRLQINLLSFVGRYGSRVRSCAEALLAEGSVDYVGSDAHTVADVEALAGVLHLPKVMNQLRMLDLGNAEWLA